jgi:uncharacterized protein YbaA (DUF1428 family)
MRYVDGFVIPVPTKNLKVYAKMAALGGKIWMEHGALQYCECVGDELVSKCGLPFPQGIQAKKGETIVFAWIVFKSKAHRNKVNALVMKDPRLGQGMDPNKMPFDFNRMLYGGFKTIVDR